ncbi:hypothetical protein C2S52_000484 [Perilla frutescens var. hirtella]|nr:hypothetical protein C2S52_000484 [Perilla frutescens var. hirtella]
MGIWGFVGSTAEAVKRNVPDATEVKNACRNSSTYGTAVFTKIGEALAAPVKSACRKSYECGSSAFAKIDHTVRTKGRRRKAADHTNVNYELIIPAEEVGMERGGLDASANSCTYGTAAFAKMGQAVATRRISHTSGFIIFAKIGYTVRVKGVCRIVQWMSADGTKSTICIYTTNFSQNHDELHDSEEGDKLIPGQAVWAPVKNECRNFYTIDLITFAKIGFIVRVKVLYRIGQWMVDDGNKSRMIMYTTIFAKNARLYALRHGCKVFPGNVAFFMILSNTLIDIINEHQKLSKEFIPGEEMHGDGVKSVSNYGNDSSSAANGSLKDEAGVFVKEFLFFMVKEVFAFMRKEPFLTQLFSTGVFRMESLAFMMREIFCVYMKQHFGAQFFSQMDEMVVDIVRELFGAKFLNDLGSPSSGAKDDLSAVFRGDAAFLAPPPAASLSGPSPSSETIEETPMEVNNPPRNSEQHAMEEVEPPECPVCLQPYDVVTAIPRILTCGHTTCEACLKLLPRPFANTIRCTVCTLLIKLPNSPSSLPKNLDLLYFSSILQRSRPIEEKKLTPPSSPAEFGGEDSVFCTSVLKPWPYEFCCKWRRWILPKDCILIGEMGLDDDGRGVLDGKVLRFFESERVLGCVLREKDNVGLAKVGVFVQGEVGLKLIKPSYESRILNVLWGLKEEERDKLGIILNATFRVSNVGKAYGFWCDEEGRCVYIVWEKLSSSNFIECVAKRKEVEKEGLSADEMSVLGMVGMEICEILSRLHFEGLIIGSLSLNCLGFSDFGRVCIDLSKVVYTGRRVSTAARSACKDLEFSLKDNLLDENLVFLSPEMLSQLIVKEGFELDSLNVYKVGPASDVWSAASLLVWVIVGSSFTEEIDSFLHSVINAVKDEKGSDYSGLYIGWKEKIAALLEGILGTGCTSLLDILCRCLGLEPGDRPMVTEVWKCFRGLIVKPQLNMGLSCKQEQTNQDSSCYIVLGDVCRVIEEIEDGLKGKEVNDKDDVRLRVEGDVVDGITRGHLKCLEMKGHLGFITCLAIGGGFLFSSSYDKIVNVWSLQDFTHVHSFNGHEHKVMAVIFVDGEQPLCISGDNEGVICIWEANFPFSEVPMKKLYEDKDWRYSGIHAMANSGTEYLYTGSGDRLVKAWSLQDHSFVCAMSGHKSVVSSLIVCSGVLYSGSWDGTVRLWSLGDHSPLTVLGEDKLGNVVPISSLSADHHMLFTGHDNGNIKIWHNDVLLKSARTHEGAVFSVTKNGKWLFSGGWDKTISVQEVSECADGMDVVPLGTIACNSPITALLYRHGKLFVGQADRTIKVYYGG